MSLSVYSLLKCSFPTRVVDTVREQIVGDDARLLSNFELHDFKLYLASVESKFILQKII